MSGNWFVQRIVWGVYAWLGVLALLVLLAEGSMGSPVRGAALLIMVLLAVMVGLLGREVWREQKRREQLLALNELGQALLRALPDPAGLPLALAAHVPALLPGGELFIWQPSGEKVFAHPLEKELPTSVLAATLQAAGGERALWRDPESGRTGVLVAAGEAMSVYLFLLPPAGARVEAYRPLAEALVAKVAAALAGVGAYEAALAEQAELYEEAVYTEAYRAELLAQRLAFERVEQELALAWQIQASFLPAELPEPDGWQLAAMLEPAHQMSGDFYDVIPLPEGRLGLVVADVADKGLGPALYMALCRTLIRTYAEAEPERPEWVLRTANARILADTRSDLFVTVFYAVLDPVSGRLTYCNAGHNPPYLLRNGNGGAAGVRLEKLTRTALPLGILEDLESSGRSLEVEPGDVLVLYTDGIPEAQDEEEGFFGEERLQRLVLRNGDRPAQIIGDKLVAAVYDFMGDAPQQDDMTLVVVVRERPEISSPGVT